jgi:hypothetical protein
MDIRSMMRFHAELFICFAGCDHTSATVWGSRPERSASAPKFHCVKHDVRSRGHQWREYPIAIAVPIAEHWLPCRTCFPKLASLWLDLIRAEAPKDGKGL